MSNRRPYTTREERDIGEQLRKNLGPEFIATRSGPAGKLSYIEGQKVITLANDIFGFNGWTSEIKETTIDYMDVVDGRVNCGVSTTVRVTLKDGTYHEDVGYGASDNAKTKGAALEKARKQAVTDGVKRALRNFGNALGNCIYEKAYVKMINQMGQPQIKYTPQNLYRHNQFDTAKREPPKQEVEPAQQQLLLEQKKHEEQRRIQSENQKQQQQQQQQQQQHSAGPAKIPQIEAGPSAGSSTDPSEPSCSNPTVITASHIALHSEESFSYGDDEFYELVQSIDTGEVEPRYQTDDGSEVIDMLATNMMSQRSLKSEPAATTNAETSSSVGTRRKLPSLIQTEQQGKGPKRSRTSGV